MRARSMAGKSSQRALKLPGRHALKFDPFGDQRLEHLRVRVRLHRIKHAGNSGQPAQGARALADRLAIVDIGCRLIAERRQQLGAFLAPPRGQFPLAMRRREQLLPGRPEHAVACNRADQQLVQLLNQPVALVFVDDEGEVQIIGSLGDEIDLLLGEELEGVSQAVQNSADVAPDETHRGARADELNAAQTLKILDQRLQQSLIETVGLRIERHRDVGLGGRDKVNGHAVIFEDLKRIGEKSHLMPHARTIERDQRDVLLDADRFDLRCAVAAFVADDRALKVRV